MNHHAPRFWSLHTTMALINSEWKTCSITVGLIRFQIQLTRCMYEYVYMYVCISVLEHSCEQNVHFRQNFSWFHDNFRIGIAIVGCFHIDRRLVYSEAVARCAQHIRSKGTNPPLPCRRSFRSLTSIHYTIGGKLRNYWPGISNGRRYYYYF